MAGGRKPGATTSGNSPASLDDGTQQRSLGPKAGVVGRKSAHGDNGSTTSAAKVNPATTGRSPIPLVTKKPTSLPRLQKGSMGPDVAKLQRTLNAKSLPSPNLDVDGIFGPLTHDAVISFQRANNLVTDGIVGPKTHYRLQINAAPTPAHAAAVQPVADSKPVAASVDKVDPIWSWTLDRKIGETVSRVPSRLTGQAKKEFEALLTAEGIALSLVFLAGFCILSGGTALLLGAFILGVDVTLSLATALILISSAATDDELNQAADELAHLVIAVGVIFFAKGVTRLASRVRMSRAKPGGAGAKGGGAPSSSSTSTAKPASPKQPTSSEPPNSPKSRSSFEKYKSELRASMERPHVEDPKLSKVMDDLYRPNAKVRSGSTADAVREEMATGKPVGGRWHTQKANEGVTRLDNWLKKNPTASPGDRAAAENVMRDLQDALGGK